MIYEQKLASWTQKFPNFLNRTGRLIALIILASCSFVPPPEFTLYQAAYRSAEEATDGVLEVFGRYERRAHKVSEAVFDPDQASLIAPGAEPPLTSLYRRGFRAVSDYNAILARYAAGESITALGKDFDALSLSLDRLGTVLSGLKLPSKAVLGAGQKLAGLALARSDAEEFGESVKRNGQTLRNFLVLVRSDTRDMYNDAFSIHLLRVSLEGRAKAKSDLKAFQEMLAGWVLLIDETIVNLEALEKAVENGPARGTGIAVLAASTERLATYAENIKVAKRQIDNAF